MRIIAFGPEEARPITGFDSVAAASVPLGDGTGESHIYAVRIAAGGSIGRHRAGFDQLFLAVEGSGWVEGEDGRRIPIAAGEGAHFAKGEMHAKGSDGGLVAVMIQVDALRGPVPKSV